jgi:hypothetical protein
MIVCNRQIIFDDGLTFYKIVNILSFRKGQCFADMSGWLLSQGAIPTLHVIGLPVVFANLRWVSLGKTF